MIDKLEQSVDTIMRQSLHPLTFKDYTLRLDPVSLTKCGEPIDISRQSLELLVYLVKHRDRVVTREELVAKFWSSDHMGADQNLNTCVRRLRKALDEPAGKMDFVETIPRVGYRFICDVTGIEGEAVDKTSRSYYSYTALAASILLIIGFFAFQIGNNQDLPPISEAKTLVAIPPGRNMCETVLFPNFLAGLRENLITDLYQSGSSQISLFKVATQDEITHSTSAEYYLDLGVRQMPDRTIANLSLVSIKSGEVVWTTQIDEPTNSENYLSTQEALSERLAKELGKHAQSKTNLDVL